MDEGEGRVREEVIVEEVVELGSGYLVLGGLVALGGGGGSCLSSIDLLLLLLIVIFARAHLI